MNAASALCIFKRFIKTSSPMNYITEMNGDFTVLSSFLSRGQFSSCKLVFYPLLQEVAVKEHLAGKGKGSRRSLSSPSVHRVSTSAALKSS